MPETRANIVDRLQQDSLDILQMPTVQARLGERAVQLTEVIEQSHYAPVDNGFIVARPEELPIVVRQPGEVAKLYAADSGLNVAQLRALRQQYGEQGALTIRDKQRAFFSANPNHQEVKVFDTQPAVTRVNYWRPAGNPDIYVSGRPYVSMNLGQMVGDKLSPIVFLHELTHVLQKHERPVRVVKHMPTDRVRAETEAFDVAGQLSEAHRDVGKQADLLVHTKREDINTALAISRSVRSQSGVADLYDPSNPANQALARGKFSKLISTHHKR